MDELPRGLGDLYLVYFERNFPDDASFQAVCSLLEVIVAAAEPLTREQLANATGLEKERELSGVLRRLSAYLRLQTDAEREEHYTVYHKSLADWLTDSNRAGAPYSIDSREGHQQLSAAGLREFETSPASMSPYAVAHLSAHLIAAEQWDELEVVLTDIAFLESKSTAGLTFDLAGDFTKAVAALPSDRPQRQILRLLEEALRRDIHFIASHAEDYPQALFQCLWNSGWWYDSPEAAKHYQPPEGGWSAEGPPWERPGPKLSARLEKWRSEHQQSRHWLRTSRPPTLPLGSAQRAVFRGHTGFVNSVVFSPDGRRILSGSYDQTVRVWDTESGEQLAQLVGLTGLVTSVAFSPDGRRILSGSYDQTVRVWDAESGEPLAQLEGHTDSIKSVVFSSDGRRILSGSWDQTERVWDAEGGTCLEVIEGSDEIQAIATDSVSEPYRLIDRGLETAVVATTSGNPIAWFPVNFSEITTHPSGHKWAAKDGNHVCILELVDDAITAKERGKET